VASARADTHVAEKSRDLPHLMGALSAGEISFDKVRTVLDVATPQTDQALCAQAKELNVRELAEVARTIAARARSAMVSPSRSEHDSRYVRFNDARRTLSAQLPEEEYARTKACVDAFADTVPSDGEKTPLDQRRCDGLTAMVDSVTPGRGATSSTTTSGTATTPTSGTATTPSALASW